LKIKRFLTQAQKKCKAKSENWFQGKKKPKRLAHKKQPAKCKNIQ